MDATASPLKAWLEKDGALLRLRLNRPKANLVDAAMIAALHAALGQYRRHVMLRGVLVDAEGPHFSFGASVEEHLPQQCATMLSSLHALLLEMLEFPVPVLVAVHGQCLGGGLELALACGRMFAAPTAQFGQPEIKLGVFPPVAAALLPRRIGRQNALDLILTGRTIAADEGVRLGLVTHAWPADDFDNRVQAHLDALLALSGPALRIAKHAVAAWLDVPFVAALQNAERLYLEELVPLPDAHEGIAAFLEKRAPVWKDA